MNCKFCDFQAHGSRAVIKMLVHMRDTHDKLEAEHEICREICDLENVPELYDDDGDDGDDGD